MTKINITSFIKNDVLNIFSFSYFVENPGIFRENHEKLVFPASRPFLRGRVRPIPKINMIFLIPHEVPTMFSVSYFSENEIFQENRQNPFSTSPTRTFLKSRAWKWFVFHSKISLKIWSLEFHLIFQNLQKVSKIVCKIKSKFCTYLLEKFLNFFQNF